MSQELYQGRLNMQDILERVGSPRDRTLRDPSTVDNLREESALIAEERTYARGADLWNSIAAKAGFKSLPESAGDDVEAVQETIAFLDNLSAALKSGYAEGNPVTGRAVL